MDKNKNVKNDLNEKTKNKTNKPYINKEGDLILPVSWKDDDDELEDEYWRKYNENV